MFVLLREGVTSAPQPKTDRRRRRERQDSSTHLSLFGSDSRPLIRNARGPNAFGWARAASPARATLAVCARAEAMNRQRNPRPGTRASGARPVRSRTGRRAGRSPRRVARHDVTRRCGPLVPFRRSCRRNHVDDRRGSAPRRRSRPRGPRPVARRRPRRRGDHFQVVDVGKPRGRRLGAPSLVCVAARRGTVLGPRRPVCRERQPGRCNRHCVAARLVGERLHSITRARRRREYRADVRDKWPAAVRVPGRYRLWGSIFATVPCRPPVVAQRAGPRPRPLGPPLSCGGRAARPIYRSSSSGGRTGRPGSGR